MLICDWGSVRLDSLRFLFKHAGLDNATKDGPNGN
jgi:hypothetical protein